MEANEEVVERILARKTPPEIIEIKIKNLKLFLTIFFTISLISFMLFTPYRTVTGYNIFEGEGIINTGTISVIMIFLFIATLLFKKMKELARLKESL